jgi:hypothetical protein
MVASKEKAFNIFRQASSHLLRRTNIFSPYAVGRCWGLQPRLQKRMGIEMGKQYEDNGVRI